MTKAIRIHAPGGPEAMKWEDVPTPEPGPGEVVVKHEAVGLNYIDVYFRTGLYKAPSMPLIDRHGRRRHRDRGRRRRERIRRRRPRCLCRRRSAPMPPNACCRPRDW